MASVERATLRKLTVRLIPFLFLLYVVNYLDRINVSFAALGMNRDLGFSATTYGLGAGLFFAGYVLCQVPANLLLVRAGARRWIGGMMIAWGFISAGMVLIQSRGMFYLLRVLLGAAEAGFFPGTVLYLTHWFPATDRARAVARFMAAIPIAAIIGAPLSGALLSLNGVGGIAGWRWLFLLEALPAMVLGLVALRYLTDRPALAHWLQPEERAWLEATMRCEQESMAPLVELSSFRMLSNGRVWALAGLWLLAVPGNYGVTFWLPQMLKEQSGQSDFVVGILSAVPFVAAIGGMILVSAHSDRTGERCLHTALPLLVSALGLIVAAFSHFLPFTLVGLSLGLAGFASICGPFWSLPSRFLHGAAAAAGIALINAIGNVGGFVGPYVLGAARDQTHSFTVGLLWLALLTLGSAAIAVRLRRASAASIRA